MARLLKQTALGFLKVSQPAAGHGGTRIRDQRAEAVHEAGRQCTLSSQMGTCAISSISRPCTAPVPHMHAHNPCPSQADGSIVLVPEPEYVFVCHEGDQVCWVEAGAEGLSPMYVYMVLLTCMIKEARYRGWESRVATGVVEALHCYKVHPIMCVAYLVPHTCGDIHAF